MMYRWQSYVVWSVLLLVLSSCTGLRRLPQGEVLYAGYEFEFVNDSLIEDRDALAEDLIQFVSPEPNIQMLWMRPSLSLHMSTKEPKKDKGFRHLLKNVLGRPPVYMKDVSPNNIAQQLEGRLFNLGYFKSQVSYRIETDSPLAFVHYTLQLQPRYYVSEIRYPTGKKAIAKLLAKEKDKSLLMPQGDKSQVFTLDLLAQERARLVSALQNQGFYYLQEDHLTFKVDSTIGQHQLHVVLQIKKNIPERATQAYHISKVVVNPDFSFGDTIPAAAQYNIVKGMRVYGQDSIFKAQMLSRHIYIKKDSAYKKVYRERSLSRLISLGVFDYANVRFEEDSSEQQGLTGVVELSPAKRKSIQAEVKVATKSNGFTGPGIDFSFTDRNLFKGAEYLKLSLDAGYEVQLGAVDQGLNSYLLGLNAEYRIPKVLSRLKKEPKRFNEFVSQTKYQLGFRSLNRLSFYQLNSLDAMAGAVWKSSFKTQHELNAVNLNYLALTNTSAEFEAKLSENQRLRQSFENQFIFGPSYYLTYSNQIQKKRVNTYFRGGLDFSGNILSAFKFLQTGQEASAVDPFTVAGLPYSQYTLVESDLRMYYHIGEKTELAYRAFAGLGLPYGNSATLPFVKQYFTGGANDNRGFAPRSVGPGSFAPTLANDSTLNFIDQTGDIKFQTNLEFRFPIFSYFKGALFTDISNIWLKNGDGLRPGAQFQLADFVNEFAVSSGFGLRLDVELFILRLDMGVPLLNPGLPEGDRYISPRLSKSAYRQEHLIYTIAIGYPF